VLKAFRNHVTFKFVHLFVALGVLSSSECFLLQAVAIVLSAVCCDVSCGEDSDIALAHVPSRIACS
jgi:hypothetical protein